MPIPFSDDSDQARSEPVLPDPGHDPRPEPWWNDGTKAAGMVTTILFIGLASGVVMILLALCARLAVWIWP